MTDLKIEEHKKWYEVQRPRYELLSNAVKNTLESLIKNAGIDYLSITTRAKELDSFVEKISRKSYRNPSQEITDLAGIRVITFIESDALKVNDLIKKSFDIDDSKSLDKSDELGIDKFGYRSFHFICGLGEARCALPEFEFFKELVCEIQVRTVLQHAWAEIEHDRNYKFAGNLPSVIKRRLHLVAGLLEIADSEFNNLSNDIDKYSEESLEKTRAGNLNIEINSISLEQYFNESEIVKFICEAAVSAGFIFLPSNETNILMRVCKQLNFSTVENIDNILKSSKDSAKAYFSEIRNKEKEIPSYGSADYFLSLIIIGRNIKKFTKSYFLRMNWGADTTDRIFDSATKIW